MTDSPTPTPTPTISPKAQGLINRVKAILLQPSATWDVIAAEPAETKALYTGYVIPLAAIGPIASAIGMIVFGVGAFGYSWHPSPIMAVLSGVVRFGLSLVSVYIMALVIDALAPSFDGQKNFIQALKVSVYSMTAAWVVGIVGLVPMLGILGLIGLYSLYLLYLGLPKLMKAPPEKSLGYTIVAVIVTAVLWIIVNAIGGALVGGSMMGAAGAMHGPLGSTVATNDAGKLSGQVKLNGVTVDLGKAQQAAERMAAEASAQQNGTTTVKVADPQVLLGLMPGSYMGVARSDDSTSSGGAAGIATAQAEGHYVLGGNTVNLQVADLGSVAGFGAMAAAMNINSSSSSATGYEKMTTVNGQMISEEYDRESKYGKYTLVRNGRLSIEASGTVDSIDTLKNLVNAVDAGKAEALSKG